MSIQTKNYQFDMFENERRRLDNEYKLGEEELLKKRVLTQFAHINTLRKVTQVNQEKIEALKEQLKEDGREFVFVEKAATGIMGQVSLNQHKIRELEDVIDHQRKTLEQLTDFILSQ